MNNSSNVVIVGKITKPLDVKEVSTATGNKKVGNMAQLVNVIAPIMTNKDEVCKQTIYYPYMAAIRYAKGNALRTCVPSDRVETEYGETGEVYGACCFHNGTYTLFLLNKSERAQSYETAFYGSRVRMAERWEMSGYLREYNDFSCPNEVALRPCATEKEISGALPLTLPPQSFTVLRYCEQEYI